MDSVYSEMITEQNKMRGSSASAYSARKTPDVKMNDALPPASADVSAKGDTFETSEAKEPKKRKGPIKALKSMIANVKKFGASTAEYSKGLIKGLGFGVVAGSVLYTGGEAVKHFKPKAKVPNKLLAGLVLAGSIAVNMWNASLNATEKNSEIDHRWLGHKNK